VGVHRYRIWNGPAPTTAALAAVATGTSIKTMLQVATPSTRMAVVTGWGFTVDDAPGADAIIELLETDTAATSLTAHVAAGLIKLVPGIPASLMTLGTSATGYTAGGEGTPTTSRVFDAVALSSVSAEGGPFLTYRKSFDQDGIPPVVNISSFLRVRVTSPTTGIDIRCFVDIEE
jgi:hypothetical protein